MLARLSSSMCYKMDAATDNGGNPATEAGPEGDTLTPLPTADPLTKPSALPIETIIYYVYNNGLYTLTVYGWYILLFVILSAIAWSKLKPHFYQWMKKREEWIDEKNFDPVKAERQQDAMLKAREKMQRELDDKAAVYQEKKGQKETQEREERIKQWEEFRVVSTAKKTKPSTDSGKKRSPPRRDYFPLGGSGGGGGGYRPSRRVVRGGG